MRRILVLSLTLTLTLGSVTGALAAWVTIGTGTAQSSAGSLPQGNTPTVPTDSTGSVELNWAATTPPAGVTLDGYRVERHAVGETDPLEFTPAGGSCSGTVDGLTCTDEDVPEGDWQYRVSPRLANWSGERSEPSDTVPVTPAASTMFVDDLRDVSGSTVGQSDNWRPGVEVTVVDDLGDPVTGVTVAGTFTQGASGTHSCDTGTAGACEIQTAGQVKSSSARFDVDSVSGGALTYSSGSNDESWIMLVPGGEG